MIPRCARHAWLVVLIVGLASGAQAAQPVARVMEVEGKATVTAASGRVRQIDALDTVYLGERMVVAAGARVVLAFRTDGHLERVKAAGEVTIGNEGCEPRGSVEVLAVPEADRRLVDATVRQLRPQNPKGVTMARKGIDDVDRTIQPIHRARILTTRPKFCWPPVPKAARYEIRLFDEEAEIWTATTRQMQMEYTGARPLKPGADYDWEVEAYLGDGTSVETFGGTFTPATEEQVARAEQLQRLATGSQVPYVTLAAAWFAEQRMVEQAIGAYERLVDLEPKRAAYHFALYGLYQQAERLTDAEKAYKKARQLRPSSPRAGQPEWLPK